MSMKTIVCFFTVIAILIFVDTSYATNVGDTFSENGVTYKVIEYAYGKGTNLSGNSKVVTGLMVVEPADGSSYSGNIIIPETIQKGTTTFPVVTVGAGAFYNTPHLKSITLPTSITELWVPSLTYPEATGPRIGKSSIEKIIFSTLETNMTASIAETFPECPNLREIHFNSDITRLYGEYCDNYSVECVWFNGKYVYIDAYLPNLRQVNFEGTAGVVTKSEFLKGYQGKSLSLSTNVSYPERAFAYLGINHVVMNSYLRDSAFKINSDELILGSCAFEGCENINTIESLYSENPPKIATDAFGDPTATKIYERAIVGVIPYTSIPYYKTATGWCYFSNYCDANGAEDIKSDDFQSDNRGVVINLLGEIIKNPKFRQIVLKREGSKYVKYVVK